MKRLPDKERQRIQIRHRASIERYGYQPKALFWQNEQVQQVRFEVLSKVIRVVTDTESALKILDVGCGFSDLKTFLEVEKKAGRWPAFEYTGLDLSPDMVESAGHLHPDAQLLQGEIFEQGFSEGHFDVVFLSGALNEVFEGSPDYAKSVISEMARIAKQAVAFNLLNNAHEPTAKSDFLQSFAPDEIMDFCQSLSHHQFLKKDYLPQDFTVFLWGLDDDV